MTGKIEFIDITAVSPATVDEHGNASFDVKDATNRDRVLTFPTPTHLEILRGLLPLAASMPESPPKIFSVDRAAVSQSPLGDLAIAFDLKEGVSMTVVLAPALVFELRGLLASIEPTKQ